MTDAYIYNFGPYVLLFSLRNMIYDRNVIASHKLGMTTPMTTSIGQTGLKELSTGLFIMDQTSVSERQPPLIHKRFSNK